MPPVITESEARFSDTCPCGMPNNSFALVCWDCSKHRRDIIPLKNWEGSFEDWQRQDGVSRVCNCPSLIMFVCCHCGREFGRGDGLGVSGDSHGSCPECHEKEMERFYQEIETRRKAESEEK